MDEVLWELAVDCDSDMEPEDDNFFARWWWFCRWKWRWSCVRWTSVCSLLRKRCGKCLFTKLSPFPIGPLFCYHDNSTFNYTKTLECLLSTCKVLSQAIHKQNTQCFSKCDYPVCLETSLGSLRPALLQHLGIVVQKGLNITHRSSTPPPFIWDFSPLKCVSGHSLILNT